MNALNSPHPASAKQMNGNNPTTYFILALCKVGCFLLSYKKYLTAYMLKSNIKQLFILLWL